MDTLHESLNSFIFLLRVCLNECLSVWGTWKQKLRKEEEMRLMSSTYFRDTVIRKEQTHISDF